jgi:hypothetical protein
LSLGLLQLRAALLEKLFALPLVALGVLLTAHLQRGQVRAQLRLRAAGLGQLLAQVHRLGRVTLYLGQPVSQLLAGLGQAVYRRLQGIQVLLGLAALDLRQLGLVALVVVQDLELLSQRADLRGEGGALLCALAVSLLVVLDLGAQDAEVALQLRQLLRLLQQLLRNNREHTECTKVFMNMTMTTTYVCEGT